jgi:formylglycine-generating enzyme required for sulfatase activity
MIRVSLTKFVKRLASVLMVVSVALFVGCFDSGDKKTSDDKKAGGGKSGGGGKTIAGIECVLVKGGTFTMGCTNEQSGQCADDEYPSHSVTLSDYYIGKYEVTQKQWQDIMGSNPSYFKGDNLPVENVSWNDVQTFINKLNAKTGKKCRLPTEAEWEFAARGGNKSRGYVYSGSNDLNEVGWYNGNQTHPVGIKSPNELGIYDMSGNVWEWCGDWYGDYSTGSVTNPVGPSHGSYRVNRGGSWNANSQICRVAFRDRYTPSHSRNNLGFRVAFSSSH